ncbi:MAG: cyclic 2,3-diphosphoglycerate synthase [Candidatus Obscuribacterales bacterium]|nr:cyclic 2,3-diphosphoglycerate synthase [Candidatus Obscuribacterales bacterium]
MQSRKKLIIMGAAGRDFHDFNVFWKGESDYQVVAFTAAQIPDIHGRMYPPVLAGSDYPSGIPIEPEDKISELIRQHDVSEVVLAYSDLSHKDVMHKAATVNAAGADFRIMGWRHTMLDSTKPVIAVCAVRTGCGKSQTTRRVCQVLKELGKKVAVVRHPMPYGDLSKQVCQRFSDFSDLDAAQCTIEEREEYEPHIEHGNLVFAGVDYEQILRLAESEADVVLWDGGNNDIPFYRPNLHIVVADPHRAGHEVAYHPGETNVRMADLVVINKVDTAKKEDVAIVEKNITAINPRAKILRADSPISLSENNSIRGRRVLVIEDGPTVTHGDMAFGAAYVAARDHGASEIVDPRPYAVGSIKSTLQQYSHITEILPAMGYGAKQIEDLEKTINATPCDVVLIGTPIDLSRVLKINKPTVRVTYELSERDPDLLSSMIRSAVST